MSTGYVFSPKYSFLSFDLIETSQLWVAIKTRQYANDKTTVLIWIKRCITTRPNSHLLWGTQLATAAHFLWGLWQKNMSGVLREMPGKCFMWLDSYLIMSSVCPNLQGCRCTNAGNLPPWLIVRAAILLLLKSILSMILFPIFYFTSSFPSSTSRLHSIFLSLASVLLVNFFHNLFVD